MQTPPLLNLPINPHFHQFWEAYPRKVAKFAAQRAFHKAIRQTTVQTMIAAISLQTKSDQWQKGFIPHPATWLNRGQWMDEAVPTPMATVEKDLRDIQARMNAIRANYGGMQTWADDDKKEFRSLKAKLSELKSNARPAGQ